MARRRLSDLLREEANKPSDDSAAAAEAEPSTEAAKEPIAPKATPTKATTAAKSRLTKQPAAPAETKPMTTTTQDESLQQQISELTAALEAQTATAKQLQTELEQMHSLKTELEQTRKELHKLTDANAKLTEELKAVHSQKTPTETSALVPSKAKAPQELKLGTPPSSAAQENPLSSFNRDVGWFD